MPYSNFKSKTVSWKPKSVGFLWTMAQKHRGIRSLADPSRFLLTSRT